MVVFVIVIACNVAKQVIDREWPHAARSYPHTSLATTSSLSHDEQMAS